MATYFITGANGFIGSYFAKELLRRGEHVVATRRSPKMSTFWDKESYQKIQWIDVDILDVLGLVEATKGVDILIHAAAFVSLDRSKAKLLHKINTEGTANVVHACLKNRVPLACFISSIAALGKPKGNNIVDETTAWEDHQTSAYAISKYYAEKEVWRGIAEGLPAFIINPSLVLGVGDWQASSLQLLNYLAQKPLFYPTGTLNYVDVRDVVSKTLALCAQKVVGERFILNGGSLSYQVFFEKAAHFLHLQAPRYPLNPWLANLAIATDAFLHLITGKPRQLTKDAYLSTTQNYVYSAEKVKKLLKSDFIPLEETLVWIANHRNSL